MTEIIKTEAGIPYYDEQMGQTKQEITDLIRLLLRQTFLLERKYDKKTGRFQYTKGVSQLQSPPGIYPPVFCRRRH